MTLPLNLTVAAQVDLLMQGTEYGDEQTKATIVEPKEAVVQVGKRKFMRLWVG